MKATTAPRSVSEQFRRVWVAMDEVWHEAANLLDAVAEAGDATSNDLRAKVTEERRGLHRFKARGWRHRWRLTWEFVRCAWRMVWRGETLLRIRVQAPEDPSRN